MSRPDFTAFHRPVIRAGVMGAEPHPIADWDTSWAKARNSLIAAGLATYHFGILFIAPHATVEMETNYSVR